MVTRVVTRREIAVNTQDLDSRSWQWSRHVAHVDEWLASARRIMGEDEKMFVLGSVIALRERMDRHARALTEVARTYDDVEAAMAYVCQRTADIAWWIVGRLAPVLVVTLGPGVVAGVGAAKVMQVLLRQLSPATANEFERLSDQAMRELLSSPGLVRAIELSVGSLDEALAGLAGIPLPVALALGSAGLGVTTTAGTARLASRLNAIAARPDDAMSASAGGETLTNTQVERRESVPARAPKNFADVLQRIPTESDSGAQVRIEQYQRTFVVYIGGTVDASLGSTAQPWDMSSNVAALGGDPAASEHAVRQAMAESGITSSDPVILVGHSQGGLIALRIAQANDVATSVVITAGAPIHHFEAPSGVSVVAFEHSDDVVPALSGPRATTDSGAATASTLYVRRSALAGSETHGSDMLPAHHIDKYIETARESGAVPDARLDSARRALTALEPSGTSTLWKARRT